jgi:hypothetical protein
LIAAGVTLIVATLGLLAIYRTPPSIYDLIGAPFALGFIAGGSSIALIFLVGDWFDERDPDWDEDS